MSAEKYRSFFVLGYGNPGRQDDGLGPKAAERIESLGLPFVTTDAAFQLNIEDAEAISRFDSVIFVDASLSTPGPFLFERIYPSDEVTFTSHSVSPGSVMKLAADHFGHVPEAYLMGIRGYSFEFEEGLTDLARANLDVATLFLGAFLPLHALRCVPGRSEPIRKSTSAR
jgi:hydrogenase maturation protease